MVDLIAGEDNDDSRFTSLLIAYDEAFADGSIAKTADETLNDRPDDQLAARMQQAMDCLKLLNDFRAAVPDFTPLPQDAAPGHVNVEQRNAASAFGRFQVLRELGRGGVGIVYLAVDPRTNRQVALKAPRADLVSTEDVENRFMREAEAASRLSHPNLISLFEVGDAGQGSFLVNEYCPGPSLAQWLRLQVAPLSPRTAATLVRQVAQGVQHAHSRGVLRRDIKPSNIMLAPQAVNSFDENREVDSADAESYVPKLTDFGMAKLLECASDQTRTGTLLGTPAYMAPEQVEGRVRDVDSRADVYSLGAVLYELLTGSAPYQGANDLDALRRLFSQEPGSPRAHRSAVPADLDAITLKCLARNRADRYPSAQHLAEDLERFLSGRPIEARPPGAAARLLKWARRRPAIAALLGVLMTSLLSVFGIVLVYNDRLRSEAARAEVSRERAEQESAASRRLLYAADVRLAQEGYLANNIVQAMDLLDRHRPKPGQEDLRGFAWHYIRGLCEPKTLNIMGHGKPVHAVAYSPDGRLLASGGEDGAARIWDAETGRQLHELRDGADEIECLAFSPDGNLLVTGDTNQHIRYWNPHTGEKGRLLTGHKDSVLCLAFSPDGKLLVSGSYDGTLRVYQVADGDGIKYFANFGVISAAAFSADGQFLIAVDQLGRVATWRISDWSRLPTYRKASEVWHALAISPTGDNLAAAGSTQSIAMWNRTFDRLDLPECFDTAHSHRIQALAFSPDGSLLASGSRDRLVKLWDVRQQRSTRVLLGHTDRVWSLAWAPDGSRLASAGADGIRIWSMRDDTPREFPLQEDLIQSAAHVGPDGAFLTGGYTGWLRAWNSETRSLEWERKLSEVRIASLKVSSDGDLLAVATSDDVTNVYRLDPWQLIFSAAQNEGHCKVIAWAPAGHRLAIATGLNKLAIVDVDRKVILREIEVPSALHTSIFTGDGRYIATVCDHLDIWDAMTGEHCFRLEGTVGDLAASANGRWLATGDKGAAWLINLKNGFEKQRLVTPGLRDCSLAFQGETLAVCVSDPATVMLWDARTGQESLHWPLESGKITQASFSPKGNELIVVGEDEDHRGRIWSWKIDREAD